MKREIRRPEPTFVDILSLTGFFIAGMVAGAVTAWWIAESLGLIR